MPLTEKKKKNLPPLHFSWYSRLQHVAALWLTPIMIQF